jgi:NAD(P)-dependent dehydrogenase (short-subunit alcohol dehydrogenase family)
MRMTTMAGPVIFPELRDRVALVTGAGSGIGRATALAFGAQGAIVAVACRTPERGQATVERIVDGGGQAFFVAADVTLETDVERLVATVVERAGRIDISVNSAGDAGSGRPLTEETAETAHAVLDSNFTSTWLSMKHVLRLMQAQKSGTIVNVASNLAHVGQPNVALYCAAKAGVVALTRATALEMAWLPIRINAVSPGPTETELAVRVFGSLEAYRQELAPAQPYGRLAKPDEIANAIVWLASDAASLITGQSILLDGGASLM